MRCQKLTSNLRKIESIFASAQIILLLAVISFENTYKEANYLRSLLFDTCETEKFLQLT